MKKLLLLCLLGSGISFSAFGQQVACNSCFTGSRTVTAPPARDIAFSPNGRCIAVGSQLQVNLYRVQRVPGNNCFVGNSVSGLTTLGGEAIGVGFAQNGRCLITVIGTSQTGGGQTSIQSSAINPRNCSILEAAVDIRTFNIAFQPIAFATAGNCVAVATVNTNVTTTTLNLFSIGTDCRFSEPQQVDITSSSFIRLAYSPDGRCLAVLDRANRTLTMYPVTGNCGINTNRAIRYGPNTPFLSGPSDIAFAPNGRCVAIANSNKISSLTLQSDCSLVLVNERPTDVPVSSLVYSDNSRCIIAASSTSFTNAILIFRTNPNTCRIGGLIQSQQNSFPIKKVVFSEGCFAALGDETFNLYQINCTQVVG